MIRVFIMSDKDNFKSSPKVLLRSHPLTLKIPNPPLLDRAFFYIGFILYEDSYAESHIQTISLNAILWLHLNENDAENMFDPVSDF